jgi:hypothetical protein
MQLTVGEDRDARRFELTDPDQAVVGHASYSVDGDTVVIDHVQTAPEHRGNGYAARLMAGLLDQLRATDRRVVPVCSYAVAYLRDHPEHQDLRA